MLAAVAVEGQVRMSQEATGKGRPARGLRPEQRAAIPPFHTLRAFEAIVSCGGIRRAAEALSVDHAAISRHLRSLEEWVGVSLIDRAPGSGGRLTADGDRLYAKLSDALAQIADISLELLNVGDDTHLSLVCAPGLASEWLTGRLGQFSATAPHVQIELKPIELEPDRSAHEIDAYVHYVPDIRSGELDQAMRSVEIARPRIIAVASAELLSRIGKPEAPADLLGLPLLHEANFDQWRRWFAGHAIDVGGHLSGPKFWQNHLTLAAARQGQGIALANALIASQDLKRGILIELGEWAPIFLGSYMFTTRRNRWREATITAFRRWLQGAVTSEAL